MPKSELVEASYYVCYEIEQFYGSVAVLRRSTELRVPPGLLKWVLNAFAESFLTHFRILYDFLYREPRGDDVAASDWFADGSWAAEPSPGLALDRKRANKDVAHLTYTRLARRGDDVFWPDDRMVREITAGLRRFVTAVPDSGVAEHFKVRVWGALPLRVEPLPVVRWDPSVIRPVATSPGDRDDASS